MNDANQSYEKGFQLIIHGGDAKNEAFRAMEFAQAYRFEEAKEALNKAKQELGKAHKIQTELIQAEAAGEGPEMNIILVHAQDHLTMGMMAIDFARYIVELQKKIQKLEGEGENEDHAGVCNGVVHQSSDDEDAGGCGAGGEGL